MKPASYLSTRFLRTGLIDTVLVVIALALAGSVLAACLSLMGAFDAQLKSQIEAPWYKEIVVSLRNPNASSASSPVTKLSTTGNQKQRLSAADLASSTEASPLISSSYIANFETQNVGVGFGGPGGFAVTRTAGGQSSGADAASSASNAAVRSSATNGAVTGGTFTQSNDDGTNVEINSIAIDGGTVGTVNGTVKNQTPSSQNAGTGTVTNGAAPDTANAKAGGSKNESNTMSGDFNPPDPAQMEAAMEALRKEAASLEQPLLSEVMTARVTAGLFSAYGLNISEGSLFTDDDMTKGLRVAVVGAELAKQLYSDGVALGKKIMLRGTTYTIIGILASADINWQRKNISPNDIMYVPVDAGQFNIGRDTVVARGPGGPSVLRYAVANSADLQTAKTQIQSWFTDKYGEGNVSVSAPVDDLTAQKRQQDLVLGAIAALAGAGMLIAGINLFNLMTTRVLRRSRSIGILRSLGASRAHVFRQFLLEAGLMCVMGAVLAFIAAPFVFNLLAGFMGESITPVLNWPILAGVALLAGVVALAAALAPANQAARTVVVDAIRS